MLSILIRNMAGDQDFNDVVFTDCFVPEDYATPTALLCRSRWPESRVGEAAVWELVVGQ